MSTYAAVLNRPTGSDQRRAAALTGSVTALLAIVTTLGFCLVGDSTSYKVFAERIRFLAILYVSLAALCTGSVWLYQRIKGKIVYAELDLTVPSSNQPSTGSPSPVPMIASRLRGILVCGRPLTSAIAGGLTLLVVGLSNIEHIGIAVAAAAAMQFATMAGFVANDLFDLEKDRRAGVGRPLASGTVATIDAKVYLVFLVFAALLADPHRGSSFAVIAYTVVGVLFYSVAARLAPLFKGVYTALLCCAPIVYGCTISTAPIPVVALATLVIFIVGREAYLDVMDHEADRAAGMRTVAHVFGVRRSKILALCLMLLGAVALTATSQGTVAVSLGTAGLVALTASFTLPFRSERTRLSSTRVAMLLGVVAIASSIAQV